MKRIEYDHSNLSRDVVGLHGVHSPDLAALQSGLESGVDLLSELGQSEDITFVDLPDQDLSELLMQVAADRHGTTDLVVIGIGGSSLGTRAVYHALCRPEGGVRLDGAPLEGCRLHFLENVDPVDVRDLLDRLPLATTLFNVVTKSGNTIETISLFAIVRQHVVEALGAEAAQDRFVLTTDPEAGPLRSLARREGFRTLSVPPGVGGRFSVLSAVGLYPLAMAGLDVATLLRGAVRVRARSLERDLEDNAAGLFAAHQVQLYRQGLDQVVLMPYASALLDFGRWFVQLWAESLGKRTSHHPDGVEAVGPTPIVALGAIDQHSQLQLYMEGPVRRSLLFLDVEHTGVDFTVPALRGFMDSLAHIGGHTLTDIRRAELQGVREGLTEAGVPNATLRISRLTEESLGGLLYFFMAATTIAGRMHHVDPFNQPGVELGKRFAHGLLGRDKESHYADRLRHAIDTRTRSVTPLF